MGAWRVVAGLIAFALCAGTAMAQGTSGASTPSTPPVSSRPPVDALRLAPERLPLLPGAGSAEIRALWEQAVGHEAQLEFEAAAISYQALIPHLPESASPHWRIARAYWRIGDGAAPEDSETKRRTYQLAADWSKRGIDRDSQCAECMLWHYAALGRLIMTDGIMSGLRRARTMSRMLDRGIDLEPSYSDNRYNSTLGNLYYARAIWNRMVPEWWFLPLVAGVKGDKRQALEDIDRAVALHPERIDYQVERGAILLCLGADRDEPGQVDAGKEVLVAAMGLDRLLESDVQDIALAEALLREPEKACGYSRAGFMDMDEVKGKL